MATLKFRCDRDVLVRALTTVGRGVGRSGGDLPVLSGIKFDLEGDRLLLTATDLSLTIQVSMPVAGKVDGVTVVPARLLGAIVRSLEPGQVAVAVSGDAAVICSNRGRFSVRALTAEEFPQLPMTPTADTVVKAAEFLEALRQVLRAASQDDARPVLTGVLMAAEAGGLRLVATDSYRLTVRDIRAVSFLAEGQSIVVPSKALRELSRLLVAAETVVLRLSARDITFVVGSVRLTTPLIVGEFPNYRQLMRSTYPQRLTIGREPLLRALRRVRLFAPDLTPARIAIRSGEVELAAASDGVGDAVETLDASYEGPEMVIAFNPAYLADGLDAIAGDEVTVDLVDGLTPVALRPADGQYFQYLLMPVRTDHSTIAPEPDVPSQELVGAETSRR
jgi:DNA polymerase-3 subunit beta